MSRPYIIFLTCDHLKGRFFHTVPTSWQGRSPALVPSSTHFREPHSWFALRSVGWQHWRPSRRLPSSPWS